MQRLHFVLGRTVEYINLPEEHPANLEKNRCLAARIEGRSSVARCGVLVHFTAPTVHPGFDGTLTLEIINPGPANFILRPGTPIAQLIIEEVSGYPVPEPERLQGPASTRGNI